MLSEKEIECIKRGKQCNKFIGFINWFYYITFGWFTNYPIAKLNYEMTRRVFWVEAELSQNDKIF
jgi:hypothetical protein